ncbi:hypothetical protein JQ604_19085 [Bradyrhizobium jicamae]|uniref:hypothetical protein n=1 Tax=Bradyrhizobium jicamae TaxID=280332 RepID=UPI001BA52354|nr:hypothetical protein [Bradyrhizobium jicamae]MBR0754294.1 hypothetical protein [Bradyrhizobium jicamae]
MAQFNVELSAYRRESGQYVSPVGKFPTTIGRDHDTPRQMDTMPGTFRGYGVLAWLFPGESNVRSDAEVFVEVLEEAGRLAGFPT